MWAGGVSGLALGTAALAVLQWRTAGSAAQQGFPWVTVAMAGVTLVVLTGSRLMRAIVRALTKGQMEPQDTGGAVTTIRPIGAPLLGWLWIGFGLICPAVIYLPAGGPAAILPMLGAVTVPVLYLAWIRRESRRLETRYPYRPPLDLLELRVFGSRHLGDFLTLTDAWRTVGTLQRLAGPGTSGGRASDVASYVAGLVENLVVQTDEELTRALDGFRRRANDQLLFPLNAVQCNHATWRAAVDRLMDRADVVVMDLADLSSERQGVAYELDLLVDRFPLDRLVLLVQDSTDMTVLEHLLREAWAAMPRDSPNRGRSAGPLVIDVGGGAAAEADESLYEWKARIEGRLDPLRLAATLADVATPPRSALSPAVVADSYSVRWTRRPFTRVVR